MTARRHAAAKKITSVDAIVEGLDSVGYIASPRIATSIFIAQNLTKPILVEGSAGVGKTELALATAKWLGLPLIRTSVDHGTALDLAGTGKADSGSLQAAIGLAIELVGRRAEDEGH